MCYLHRKLTSSSVFKDYNPLCSVSYLTNRSGCAKKSAYISNRDLLSRINVGRTTCKTDVCLLRIRLHETQTLRCRKPSSIPSHPPQAPVTLYRTTSQDVPDQKACPADVELRGALNASTFLCANLCCSCDTSTYSLDEILQTSHKTLVLCLRD